ncbi:MAG TPA: SdrD B-like domain-containing protein [Nocardioides sp.]|uniref:SdrD B-like domain-containing protein n=1 Tax=Nocardioides sp. TaxID=35761 RepID=UPI002BB60D6F|nr:SdrD B-like domain-containing protein [Nocardioides sp.]HTW13913.1 SdrD B-like domain-containing protein [Nocardioides sp.]
MTGDDPRPHRRSRNTSRRSRIAAWAGLAVLAAFLAIVPLPVALTPAANAVAEVEVSQSIPGNTLIGRETPVEVTFTNPGDTTAYNLAFTVTLPLGVSVSSSDQPPTRTIVETDASGNPVRTVVVWENLVDIVPGGTYRFHYSLQYDVGSGTDQWEVGDQASVPVNAYVNDLASERPVIEPSTGGDPVTAEAADFTDTGSAAGATTLVPVLLTKSEPSPEAELLRGVHDHQTVYTLTLETGEAGGVGLGAVEDWLPAGIEFLGCGTADNSSAEEYPGSGPLNPGNAPAAPECIAPDVVETVDSGLPAGLAPGVYTHVVWNIGAGLPASQTSVLQYVAGIPQRENTMDWAGPTPPAGSGLQASNLDNNTGPLTTQVGDGTTWTNQAQVNTSFGGTDTVVTARETVQAVDLAVYKTVDTPTIEQGAVSTWTLHLRSSEYVTDGGISGVTVVDTTPDGTCPIGSVHPRCASTTAPPPSPAYSGTSFDGGSGETTLTWDLAETFGPNVVDEITFSTVALQNYVSSGAPVSANDSWTNTATLAADVETYDELGPDDPDGREENAITDDTSREQSGSSVVFAKDVGLPGPGGECGDGVGVTWNPDVVDAVGPGDRVCWRLTARAPDYLDSSDDNLVDFLPPGFRYEAPSIPGPDSEIDPDIVLGATPSGSPATGVRLDWTLTPNSTVEPAQTVQAVVSTVLDGGVTPDLGASGDRFTNTARFSFRNSNGEVFVVPDDASVTFAEAHLGLTKAISGHNADTFDPAIDPLRDVVAGDTITYRIAVTNDGTRDAVDAVIWDLLPRGVGPDVDDAVCADITAIDPAGACSAGDDRITWTGVDIPAGETVLLSYTWEPPGTIPVGSQWTNHAGVVEYRSETNSGTTFTYVPRDNIDPTREPDANTDRADDTANVYSPGITLAKRRTTAIEEPGNALANQATIGEVIHYEIESRQSGGTSAESYELTDDLADRGQLLVPLSATASSGLVDAGGGCDETTGQNATIDYPTTNQVRARLDGPITPAVGETACFVLRFDAVVRDVPAGGDSLNRRPNNVTNRADLVYHINGGTDDRRATATISTQVVEPNITISKSADATATVLPGDDIAYSLVVTNASADAVTTAHDVVVVDDFSGVPVASVVANPDGGDTSVTDRISWTIDELAPGASVTLRYTVRLQENLVANSTFTNDASVTTTSLDGADPDERTSTSPCATTGPPQCPGYADEDAVTLRVAGPLLTKDRATRLHPVGGEAQYTVQAVFPSGLDFGSDVTVTDDLSNGTTSYVETVNWDCTGCSVGEQSAFTAPPPGTAGDPTWELGALPSTTTTRTYTITYTVRILDLPATGAGDTLTNTATLTYDTGSLTDTAAIDIAEPVVTIEKRVATDTDPGLATTTSGDPKRGAIGDTVTYQLTVRNTGDWVAYDVAVQDLVDTRSAPSTCTDDARLEVDDVSDGPSYDVTDAVVGDGDNCLGFTVPSILPGGAVLITYTLAVPDDFPVAELVTGPEIVNEASVQEYFTIPGPDRDDPDYVRTYPDTIPTVLAHVDLDGGELGDTVWLDLDADGVQDPGEPGIPGVDVTATWFGPDGVPGGGDDVAYDRTTDANGIWLTDDATAPPPTLLPAGEYRVDVDTSTLPPGLTNTGDPDGGNDDTSRVSLAENASNLDQDFGYAGTGSLGDRVWFDLDGDGNQDAGEIGIAGVTVALVWAGFDGDLATIADNVDYGTEVTAADGTYTFTDLPAGPFRATVTAGLPSGLEPTYDLTPPADGVAQRTLTAGEDATDVDFGYTGTGSVGDDVWFDTDGDGVRDASEKGISQVEVEVTWSGFGDDTFGDGNEVTVTRTTDAAGGYLVDGLPAGRVRVTVDDATLPGDVVPTFDLDGIGTPHVAERQLAAGEDARDVDFGYRGAQSIGDLVWHDVDGDGNGPDTPGPDADPSEPGIEGQAILVVWAGRDGDFATSADNVVIAAAVTTDDTGRWTVDGVPTGNVRATLEGAPYTTMRVSYDREGARDGVGTALVTSGDDDVDYDFGLAGEGSLGDTVWLDVDENGQVDAGEPRIPNVEVSIFWAGFDGSFGTADDLDLGTVVTDAQGEYLVDGLAPGRYRVDVVAASLPSGVRPVYDLDGGDDNTARRDLTQAENARDVDFGYAGTGTIGDYVWWDLDGDAVQDPTEPGLPDVGVTLDWAGFDGTFGNADDRRLTTRTDAEGGYLFPGLPAGAYRDTITRADLPRGLRATADPDGGADSTSELTLAGGASDLDQDFGYVGDAAIGDLVWRDMNDDGTRQADEPAISGARVSVRYLGPDGVEGGGDDVVITQRTGSPPRTERRAAARGGAPAAGEPSYLVGGLAPGSYVVTLDGTSITAPDAPSSDLDGGDPTITRLTLTASPRLDADFAVFRNDDPEFDGGDSDLTTGCGDSITVDPFASVDDANGDRLQIVPGSIEVPDDVVVERTDDGRLRITAETDDDFTVRYRVADGRGGEVQVELPVSVSTSCDDDGGIPLPATGAEIPPWLLWLGLGLVLVGSALTLTAVRRRS